MSADGTRVITSTSPASSASTRDAASGIGPVDDPLRPPLLAPVVVVALEHDLLVLLPRDDPVRPGARGAIRARGRSPCRTSPATVGFTIAADTCAIVGSNAPKGYFVTMRTVRSSTASTRSIMSKRTQALVIGHRVQHAREVAADGLGVERCAVVEADALAEVERPRDAVGRHLPALGQARHDLHVVVEADQGLVHHHDDLIGLGVGRVVRVERRRVRRGGEHQRVARCRGRATVRSSAACRGQQQHGQHACQSLHAASLVTAIRGLASPRPLEPQNPRTAEPENPTVPPTASVGLPMTPPQIPIHQAGPSGNGTHRR